MDQELYFFDLNYKDLQGLFEKWEAPSYRAYQVWEGIYKHLYSRPDLITSLPGDLRNKLGKRLQFFRLQPISSIDSKDRNTHKILFQLPDNLAIETVLMTYNKRQTLCVSTQAGCAMGCVFCATGQMGFKRNLSSGEIVEQVIYFARLLQMNSQRVTNVVLMGMGEPFHNYEATMAAIDRLNHPEGFGLGSRRFTISTVGIIPMIVRFAKERKQINLAISLHTVDDALRSSMLPINKKYPVNELLEASRYYVATTNRRITFEWALIRDINDTPEQAHQLGKTIGDLQCHVNIIPLNPTKSYSGKATTQARAKAFKFILEGYGIPCTIRVRRGIDIQAGCGQLAINSKIHP